MTSLAVPQAADHALPTTLYARVRERLRADILAGRLAPDQRLPSESALTSLFGVSRITVRQALEDLKNQGLIVKVQGKGAFVARPAPVTASFDRIEGLASAVSMTGRSIRNRRLRIGRRRAPREVAAQLAIEPGTEVVALETVRFVDGVPLSVNRSWMPRTLGTRIARLDLSARDLIDVYQRELGQAVTSAALEIRAVTPTPRQARLLRIARDLPCLELHRVLLSAADRPVLYEVALHRGDLYSHRSTSHTRAR